MFLKYLFITFDMLVKMIFILYFYSKLCDFHLCDKYFQMFLGIIFNLKLFTVLILDQI